MTGNDIDESRYQASFLDSKLNTNLVTDAQDSEVPPPIMMKNVTVLQDPMANKFEDEDDRDQL